MRDVSPPKPRVSATDLVTHHAGAYCTCPHCGVPVGYVGGLEFAIRWNTDSSEHLTVVSTMCPICKQYVVTLVGHGMPFGSSATRHYTDAPQYLVWPLHGARPVPPEVPPHIAEDYTEAAAVLSISPKASAALSRRCLEIVLTESGEATKRNLSAKIEEVRASLPEHIAENLHAVREVGNLAAHPIKDEHAGEIVNVEPGEAEWNLEVLDQLFDFYYVKPAKAKARRDALNEKLIAAGRDPI